MRRFAFLAAASLAMAAPAFASNDQHGGHHAQATAKEAGKEAAAALAQGEVKKVDKGAGKMTIKHGPLANLDMPPMTMVFHVKDPAMLDQVKAGDAIRFKAEKVGGNYTVTELKPAK